MTIKGRKGDQRPCYRVPVAVQDNSKTVKVLASVKEMVLGGTRGSGRHGRAPRWHSGVTMLLLSSWRQHGCAVGAGGGRAGGLAVFVVLPWSDGVVRVLLVPVALIPRPPAGRLPRVDDPERMAAAAVMMAIAVAPSRGAATTGTAWRQGLMVLRQTGGNCSSRRVRTPVGGAGNGFSARFGVSVSVGGLGFSPRRRRGRSSPRVGAGMCGWDVAAGSGGAAPSATACLGWVPTATGSRSSLPMSSATSGILDDPPARTVAATWSGVIRAERSARRSDSTVPISEGRIRSSNSCRVSRTSVCASQGAARGWWFRYRGQVLPWPAHTPRAIGRRRPGRSGPVGSGR